LSESAPNFNTYLENEREKMPEIMVTEISEGLGFGHGSISTETADSVLQAEVHEIVHTDPEIVVEVDTLEDGSPVQDDGCGDGRGVKTIFTKAKEFARSLHRSKILGGGGAMTVAARIATGDTEAESLNDDFADAAKLLIHKGIDFGAHTAEHASGEKSGCGAIDEAHAIIRAAVQYKEPITQVMNTLGVSEDVISQAYSGYESYADILPEEPDYSGKEVVDTVIEHGKVVKELEGEHKELRIVLNMIKGYTVNQELVRELTQNKAQVFAVDVWRLEEIADRLYEQDTHKAQVAFAGEVIYTLATTGVLTKGDLPVDIIEEQQQVATLGAV